MYIFLTYFYKNFSVPEKKTYNNKFYFADFDDSLKYYFVQNKEKKKY